MNYLKTTVAIFLITIIYSCTKGIDKKPSSTQVTAETIADLQRLMDNQQYIYTNRPFLGELGCDDYYTITAEWSNFDVIGKYSYIWDKDPFHGATINDWSYPYTSILYANVALEKAKELEGDSETPDGIFVRGQAYFHRAFSFWSLAQIFCKAYDPVTAASDPGIPLRLSSDPEAKVPRATVQETYDQIIKDLLESKKMLPATSTLLARPSQLAVNALLARVYLSMGDINKAWEYANQVLLQYNKLIDYNTIQNTSIPFKQFNEEIIFFATMGGAYVFNINNRSPVDSVLYDSYDDADLRKVLFFSPGTNNTKVFKGTYAAVVNGLRFCGTTTAEMYLIRAECYARNNMITEAMNDVNTLLRKRWNDSIPFKPYQAITKEQALNSILADRRKELVFRGLRWSDIRRLNVLGQQITLKRYIGDQWYTLSPGNSRFVYPIPEQEFIKNPIPQNVRE